MVKVLGKEIKPLKVLIKNRIETLYEGTATSITSVNDNGEFDILPLHANFITLIRNYVIIDKDKKTQKKFKIEKGLLSAIVDDVSIYVGL